MFKELAERWDVVPIDVRSTTRDGKPVPGIIVADLTNPDRNAYRQHFKGADAVIHCGFVSAPNLDATTWQDNSDAKFWAEHENIAHAYNVHRTAPEEGVRRVDLASANNAAEHGAPFVIVYGIRGNTHRVWSIATGREKIGYAPEDDSQVNFADKIAAIARAAKK